MRFLICLLFFQTTITFAEEDFLNNTLTVINIGEGDSILLQSANETALIDAGNLKSAPKLLEVLSQHNATELKYLIFTHPHPDHISGAFGLISHLKISQVFDNGENLAEIPPQDTTSRWYRELFRDQLKAKPLLQGNQLTLAELTLTVIWPRAEEYQADWNTNSLVILVEAGDFRALLMGDANLETEKKLLNSNKNPFFKKLQNIKVLKLGHHGAPDTGSEEFIKFVRPEISLLSINSDNINGYPSEKTLASYTQVSSKLLRTDFCGDIELRFSKSGRYEIISQCR